MTVLVLLRAGVAFEAEAAASWARMEAEHGSPLDTNRTTVSRAEQQEKRDDYLAYLNGGPWAPFALPPDESWHCPPIARAADTDDDEWIRAHPDHGWRFVVRGERWHAQYYPTLDKHRDEGHPTGGDAHPITEQEDVDMPEPIYIRTGAPAAVYAIHPLTGRKRPVPTAEWNGAQKQHGAVATTVTQKQLDEVPNA